MQHRWLRLTVKVTAPWHSNMGLCHGNAPLKGSVQNMANTAAMSVQYVAFGTQERNKELPSFLLQQLECNKREEECLQVSRGLHQRRIFKSYFAAE